MRKTPNIAPSRGSATARKERQADMGASPLSAMDAASVAWRGAQADADADIEGLARDPGADALIASMDRAQVPLDQQRERLIAYYRGEDPQALAAE